MLLGQFLAIISSAFSEESITVLKVCDVLCQAHLYEARSRGDRWTVDGLNRGSLNVARFFVMF